jgi:hypothetical protein
MGFGMCRVTLETHAFKHDDDPHFTWLMQCHIQRQPFSLAVTMATENCQGAALQVQQQSHLL